MPTLSLSAKARRRALASATGSMALPTPVADAVARAHGSTLLERYGMTELGMALSNPSKASTICAVGEPLPAPRCSTADQRLGEELDALLRRGRRAAARPGSKFKEHFQGRRPQRRLRTVNGSGLATTPRERWHLPITAAGT